MKPRRVSVLLNVSSGKVGAEAREKLQAALQSAFAKHGINAELEFLSGAELRTGAERALRRTAEGKLAAMVVGGGDGSISTVASVLADSGASLGIIPLGTLNHFAKDLKLPLAIEAAVNVIAEGETRSVDAGEVNGRIFINNSSIGIYPYLVIDRERRRRRNGLSKWLAMAWALLRAFRHFPLRRLSIRGEGWIDTERSPCVFIGNNKYLLTGVSAGRREELDGGQLCLYVAKQQSMGALLWLACRAVVGLLNHPRDLRAVLLSSVEVSSRHRKLLVALDGEVELVRSPLRYRIRPKALRVFAPSSGAS